MQIDMDITANLSPSDVENIIKDYLGRQGYEVDSVTIKMDKKSVGYGPNEHDETVFNGIEAKVRKKPEKSYSQFDR
jgi:hypothetical protein